jgi:hypothetical protein
MLGNRKKAVWVAGVLMAACVMLWGCADAIPDMNDTQADAVEQYAAVLLMKYDKGYKKRLVELPEETQESTQPDTEESMPSTEPVGTDPSASAESSDGQSLDGESASGESTGTESASSESGSSEGQPADGMQTMPMETFLGLPEGVTVAVSDIRTADYYPDTSDGIYNGVGANAGYQILVIEFVISNQTSSDQTIDILDLEPGFRVTVNGSINANVLTSFLLDDLSTYEGTIPAGGGEKTVLLAQIPKDIVPESITLLGSNGTQTAVILDNYGQNHE